MNKDEFMEKLKEKLTKLNSEDREDAINYYWEYFEEAGFGEESDVTKNVGNPDEVAAKIIETAEYAKDNATFENRANNKKIISWVQPSKEDTNPENEETKSVKDIDTASEPEKKESLSEVTALDIFKGDKKDAFDSIDIDISELDVILRTGDEFGISINCKGEEPLIEIANNCLIVKDVIRTKFIKLFNFNLNIFNKEKGFIEIIVPRDKKLNKVKSRLDLGKFSLFAITADSLDIKTDMGSLELVSATAYDCKLKADMGHISVKDSSFNTVKVKSGMGAVNIKFSKADTLKASTDAGYISLENAEAENMELKSDAGYIKIYGGNIGKISAKTDAGLIKIDKVSLKYLEARSDTGSISAKLPGSKEDYRFNLKNSLGVISVGRESNTKSIFDNSYVDNTGEIPVEIRVDTGKINIEFLER